MTDTIIDGWTFTYGQCISITTPSSDSMKITVDYGADDFYRDLGTISSPEGFLEIQVREPAGTLDQSAFGFARFVELEVKNSLGVPFTAFDAVLGGFQSDPAVHPVYAHWHNATAANFGSASLELTDPTLRPAGAGIVGNAATFPAPSNITINQMLADGSTTVWGSDTDATTPNLRMHQLLRAGENDAFSIYLGPQVAGADQANVPPPVTSGDDDFFLTPGNDIVNGFGGDDRLIGLAGDDTLFGGAGADTLSGDTGNDDLDGGAGNDSLFGGVGDDTLSGGAGDDVLDGAAGSDRVDGGDGANDVAVYGNRADYMVTATAEGFTITSLVNGDVDTVTGVEFFRFGAALSTPLTPASDLVPPNPAVEAMVDWDALGQRVTDYFSSTGQYGELEDWLTPPPPDNGPTDYLG